MIASGPPLIRRWATIPRGRHSESTTRPHSSPRLQHFDGMHGQPDVQLLEPAFEPCFVGSKEVAIRVGILRVHEYAHQFIAIGRALMTPTALQDLRFPRRCAEAILQIVDRFGDQFGGNDLAVVKPQREQHLEATQGGHKSRVLPP